MKNDRSKLRTRVWFENLEVCKLHRQHFREMRPSKPIILAGKFLIGLARTNDF